MPHTKEDKYPDDNFFTHYFNYIGYPHNTEAALNIHRWSAISIIAALLGRNFTFDFGFFSMYPNQYIQIVGPPAAKKSTAIKQAIKVLKKVGVNKKMFAADKTSLQQFLIDLHELTWGDELTANAKESNGDFSMVDSLFATEDPIDTAASLPIAEMFITSDEFVDFIGRNNIDFISLLGTLWDIDEVFTYKLKNSKPVYANKPTINIISGNTYEGFHQAFPPEMQGQGFFSRLLLIHAEPTGRKVKFPAPPTIEASDKVVSFLIAIRNTCLGSCTITDEAKEIAGNIYESWKDLDDPRFAKYSGRRYMHMLKLAIVCTAARISKQIEPMDIIMANTLLTYAEYSMPKAMGQFGKGKHSATTHKILELITSSEYPVSMRDIIKHVHNDVDQPSVINDLIMGLTVADKIQSVDGGKFLPKIAKRAYHDTELVKPSWLWPEERKF
jgi:hypothetical protein